MEAGCDYDNAMLRFMEVEVDPLSKIWPPKLDDLYQLHKGDWRLRHYVRSIARRLTALIEEGRRAMRQNNQDDLSEICIKYALLSGDEGYPWRLDKYLGLLTARSMTVRTAVIEIIQFNTFPEDDEEKTIDRYLRPYPVDRIASIYARYRWQDLQHPPEAFTGVYRPLPRPGARDDLAEDDQGTREFLEMMASKYANRPWHKLYHPEPWFTAHYFPLPKDYR